jgi:hypothetical protein
MPTQQPYGAHTTSRCKMRDDENRRSGNLWGAIESAS